MLNAEWRMKGSILDGTLILNPSPTRQKQAGEKDLKKLVVEPFSQIEDLWEKGRVERAFVLHQLCYFLKPTDDGSDAATVHCQAEIFVGTMGGTIGQGETK